MLLRLAIIVCEGTDWQAAALLQAQSLKFSSLTSLLHMLVRVQPTVPLQHVPESLLALGQKLKPLSRQSTLQLLASMVTLWSSLAETAVVFGFSYGKSFVKNPYPGV